MGGVLTSEWGVGEERKEEKEEEDENGGMAEERREEKMRTQERVSKCVPGTKHSPQRRILRFVSDPLPPVRPYLQKFPSFQLIPQIRNLCVAQSIDQGRAFMIGYIAGDQLTNT